MNETETQTVALDHAPMSWAGPGATDHFSFYGLLTFLFIVFLVIYLYAVFDRYAGRKGEESLFRTTIPTMLTVGLAYDILPPLEGVNVLLPASLIVAAAARDIVLWSSANKAARDD